MTTHSAEFPETTPSPSTPSETPPSPVSSTVVPPVPLVPVPDPTFHMVAVFGEPLYCTYTEECLEPAAFLLRVILDEEHGMVSAICGHHWLQRRMDLLEQEWTGDPDDPDETDDPGQ